LCSSSPESTEREETSTASPDLNVVKAKLNLAECERKKAELSVILAQIEAKDKKGPTKKRHSTVNAAMAYQSISR
jgi:hypothetical protein